jgi:hypothetical protein
MILIAILMQAAPVAAQSPVWQKSQLATAETLFAWNVEHADNEPKDPRLVTDRPHFSEASSLVGLGVVQLETGYSIFSDRSNAQRTTTHSFPEPLLRMGLFAEWFEFRIASNYLIEQTSGQRTVTGVDDLYVGAKLAIAKQAGVLPELAIFPQMRVPAGSQAFSAGQVLPGVNIAYSWKLNELLELECNTQFNNRRDDALHTYLEAIQTLNLEYDLSEKLGAFTELIAFLPTGDTIARQEYYFHAGFQYFVTVNVQLDIHAGVGLNEAAADLAFTGVGVSARF